jgi:hypothetical protein
MPDQDPAAAKGRIIDIRDSMAVRRSRAPANGADSGAPDEHLRKYTQPEDDDDYRHRMITNVIALAFLAFLVVGGIWIANTMAAMRKSQDCVLSGRPGCTPVEAPTPRRW